MRYMRIITRREEGGSIGIHSENLDIAGLLALNLDKMEDGEVFCIGDRNSFDGCNLDIERLAIEKTVDGEGNASFRFGTARFVGHQGFKSSFEEKNLVLFWIYETDIGSLSVPENAAAPSAVKTCVKPFQRA
jgi:hypothetical protein